MKKIFLGLIITVLAFTAFKVNAAGIIKYSQIGPMDSLGDKLVYSILIDPTNNNRIYIGTGNGILFSSDGGINWQKLINDIDGSIDKRSPWEQRTSENLLFDPLDKNWIYYTSDRELTRIKLDDYLVKNAIGSHPYFYLSCGTVSFGVTTSFTIDQINPSIVYSGNSVVERPLCNFTMYGIAKTLDRGKTQWGLKNNGILFDQNLQIMDLVIDPHNFNIIYAATNNIGIYKTVNGGDNWIQINNGLSSLSVNKIVIDNNNSSILYTATFGGVFKSENGGISWAKVLNEPALSLIIDPLDSNIIYAASNFGGTGFFRSIDGGNSWDQLGSNVFGTASIKTMSLDNNNRNILYLGTFGNGLFRVEIGNSSSQLFWSEVQNAPNWLRLRATPGIIGKPESDILKTVPNGWAVKVLKTTDENNNNIDIDGYRWYQIEDKTDGTIGWMAAKNLTDSTVYLGYDQNNQSDLQNKAEVQLDTAEKRKPVILDAVNNYHAKDNSLNSLYGGGGGLDDNNNFQRFIQGSNFPKELTLSIAAQESGSSSNNEVCSSAKDGGIGIMQITSPSFKGLGSGLDNVLRKNDCDARTGWIGNFSKYYSNTIQGVYANIKDGFRVLQQKYRQKCPKDSIVVSGYTFSCQDIEKILTTWGYNGFAKDKDTGLYTGNYLKYVADKLRNLSNYFTGIFYSNPDNLIEKLEIANNNKQIIKLYSPATFHIVDSVGRATGLINDSVAEEIPNSLYEREAEGAAIFFPSDSYRYRVVGTTNGVYSFSVDYTKNGILKTFKAADIPIHTGEIHEYIIDWDALDRGERGVLLNIDYNGDETVDQIIHSDNYLYDIEPPQIAISSPSADEYVLNSQLQIQFNATDNVSGIASVVATLNDVEVINNQTVILTKSGINILKIIATDNDGNITTLTKTFNVAYNFRGFLPPIKIDGSGIYNKNRTLPVKFQLTDVNNQYISIAIAQLFVAKIQDAIVGIDEIPLSTSAADFGNLFRYDSINNQYIYNLSTDTITVGSWQLKVILDSGQVFTVIVSIK